VNFSSQETSVTTCILLLQYFATHGKSLLPYALHPCPRPITSPLHRLASLPTPKSMARRFSRHCLIQLRNGSPNIPIQLHITKCKSPRFDITKTYPAYKW
jgi:hypothetical protein